MLRGDLALTPLDEVLRLLADDQLTGRLALNDGGKGAQTRSAEIYVATGEIYAAWLAEADADPVLVADERLRLRLLAEGTLRPDAWDDALAAQEELYDWSIGELLVELGHLERDVLERVAREELLDAVAQASGWTLGSYRFRRRERTRNRAGRTYTVSDLLEAVSGRRDERHRLRISADAVPSPGDGAPETVGLEAAVLGLVDGVRSVADIEVGCGCTGLEVAGILRSLADQGHVSLPAPPVELMPEDAEPVVADVDDPVSRWSALLDATLPPAAKEEEPRSTVELVRSDLPARPVENLDPETAERRARLRARAAEELLAAQAEAEALREAEVARAALAAELSVVESLAVIETPEEPEPSEHAEVPVESVEAPVELAEAAEQSAELPEPVDGQTIDQPPVPTSEAATDLQPTPILDLIAEELLAAADLPLAVVPSEAAAEDLTLLAEQTQVGEPGPPAAEVDPVVPQAVDEAAAPEPEVQPTEASHETVVEPDIDEQLIAVEEALTAIDDVTVDPPVDERPGEPEPAMPNVVDEVALDATMAEQATEAINEVAVEPSVEPPMAEQVAESVDEVADPTTVEPAEEHDPALAAALLRELSNLGLDDEPAPALTATRAPRVPAPRHAAPARKKRGIFGR